MPGWGTKSITKGPKGDIYNPGLGAGWVLISGEGCNIWTPTSIISAQQLAKAKDYVKSGGKLDAIKSKYSLTKNII